MACARTSETMKIPMKTDELFRRHAAFVARFLSRLGVGGDELDDAVQEVFLVVHRHGGYSPGPATATSYLASIAIRAAANHRRRGRKSRERSTDVAPDETSSPSQDPARSLETHESLEQLQQALDELDPALKATLVLAELEGENCKTIAAALRVPVGTVYWRLHRARKEFKVALETHALAREARLGEARRPLGQAALGSILFARSPAGHALAAARAQPLRYDVAGALSRFHAMLQAGASLPSWAPGAFAASAGTGLGLTSPALLSAVAAIHIAGVGVAHLRTDLSPGSTAGREGAGLTTTAPVVLAGFAQPRAFAPLDVVPDLAAPVEPAAMDRGATVEPRRPALYEKARSTATVPPPPHLAPPDPDGASEVHEIQQVASAERMLAASPADALALVDSDDATAATRYLAEERRYIGVMALFRLGRVDEARARAATFVGDYPDGPYTQRVQATVARSIAR
jgi:RNA polymerase sigma-70 factor (ECF subfamily)